MKRAARPRCSAYSRPAFSPSTVSAVASASAHMQRRCSTVTLVHALRNRIAAARIDRMRKAPAADLEISLAVAGGGDGQTVQRNHRLRRTFERHPPRRPVRLRAAAAKLAADLDQMIVEPQPAELLRNKIDRETFRHARQIELHAAGLKRAPSASELELPFTSCSNDLLFAGKTVARTRGPKSPKVDHRARGRIKRATGFFRHRERILQHLMKLGRQLAPCPGRGAIEPADVALRDPRAHLRDDEVERALDALTDRVQADAVPAPPA